MRRRRLQVVPHTGIYSMTDCRRDRPQVPDETSIKHLIYGTRHFDRIDRNSGSSCTRSGDGKVVSRATLTEGHTPLATGQQVCVRATNLHLLFFVWVLGGVPSCSRGLINSGSSRLPFSLGDGTRVTRRPRRSLVVPINPLIFSIIFHCIPISLVYLCGVSEQKG